LQLLQRAHELAPDDARIKKTLDQAATAKPEDPIFSSKLSVSFDDGTL
jgi:hypothetical protein